MNVLPFLPDGTIAFEIFVIKHPRRDAQGVSAQSRDKYSYPLSGAAL